MSSDVKTDPKPCCQKSSAKKLIKISELPIYGNPYPRCDRVVSEELGYIENGIKTIREEITPYLKVLDNSSERVKQIIMTSYEHSKSTYEYISAEGNTIPKAIAITSGGLLGLLLSSRKGFFKKVLYTSAGLTAASAACYPQEANELSRIGFFIVKTKGPELIKEYTGIDFNRKKGVNEKPKTEPKSMDQLAEEVSSVQYYGFRLSESPHSTNPNPNPLPPKGKADVKGDYGMSQKQDQDLYANRSTK